MVKRRIPMVSIGNNHEILHYFRGEGWYIHHELVNEHEIVQQPNAEYYYCFKCDKMFGKNPMTFEGRARRVKCEKFLIEKRSNSANGKMTTLECLQYLYQNRPNKE